MQFWCSARDTAWSWTWTPYVGVWLFIVVLGVAVAAWNRAGAKHAGVATPPMHPLVVVALLLLWLALDWPIGALGAGYLASVHMLQFLLVALVVPPVLLLGVSKEAVALITTSESRLAAAVRWLIDPLHALILFNIVVLVTHLPAVVDSLMMSQGGNMLIDLLWIAAGTMFWLPVVHQLPGKRRFPPPMRMLYLMVGLMFSPVMFGLVGFLVYSETPLYGVYELAPPFPGISSQDDHQLAGTAMSVGGATIAFIGISIIFFNWNKTEG